VDVVIMVDAYHEFDHPREIDGGDRQIIETGAGG